MKIRSASPQKFIFLSSVSAIMTVLTVIFGGAFLRVLQRSYGSLAYWGLGVLLAAAFWGMQSLVMVVLIASLWLSLGLQMELEKRGIIWWINGLLSTMVGFTTIWIGGIYVLQRLDLATAQSRAELMKEFTMQLQTTTNGLKLDPEVIIPFLPAFAAVLIILHLGLSLIFEKRAFFWFRLPRERYVSQVNLLEIKWPDFFLWAALFSLLLTVVNFGNTTVLHLGQNLVTIFSVLYFFQGLAVTEFFLKTVQAGFFFRFLTYFILVGHLFFVLSFVGFIDFWLDFRQRLRKNQQVEKTDNSI